MYRLSALFEEDIEMQDALDDMEGIVGDSEDIIISTIEDHKVDHKPHLFDDPEVNDDGLTNEEEAEAYAAIIDDDTDDETIEDMADDSDDDIYE